MTQDEQNDLDIQRMTLKRAEALLLLDDFKKWYMESPPGAGNQILYLGLMRDILRGTEDKVDRLIDDLTDRNGRALLKKLSLNA
jgi:hypothetical protein